MEDKVEIGVIEYSKGGRGQVHQMRSMHWGCRMFAELRQ